MSNDNKHSTNENCKESSEICISKLHGKKIFFIFGSLDIGGAERQGLHLASYLKNHCGADVHVWGLNEQPGKVSELCDIACIRWKGIPFNRFNRPGQKYLLHIRIKEIVEFVGLIKNEKPDIIIPYTYRPNVLCGLAWRFTGAKLCVWNQRDEGLLLTGNLLNRLAVWLTPSFLTNSVIAKNFMLNNFRVRQNKIEVIRNGVFLTSPQVERLMWRESLNLRNDCFVACMLANIHQYKDHATLIKAWHRALDSTMDAAVPPVLLLAGRIDEGGEELKKLTDNLKIGDSVRFIGEVDDVAGLLKAVDLCVHSSKSEGLPNAILEAMSAGLPVVATDIPGIREAVGPDGYRFLAPPGDSQVMAEYIEDMFRKPDLRTEMGRKMQWRVQKEFNLLVMCTKTVSFIAEKLRLSYAPSS